MVHFGIWSFKHVTKLLSHIELFNFIFIEYYYYIKLRYFYILKKPFKFKCWKMPWLNLMINILYYVIILLCMVQFSILWLFKALETL